MNEAAVAFLAALRADQAAIVQMPFEDTNQRLNWHYIPRDRPGLALREMESHQRRKCFELLDTALGQHARTKARTIISLESILAAVEGPQRRFCRDPELYHVVIFGSPGGGAAWSWRFEGHHLSVNCTVVDNQYVVPAPVFFGANPAQVRHGERKGLRALKEEEDVARDLLASLDGEQKKAAIISSDAPDDILTRNSPRVRDYPGTEGLHFKEMTALQREVAIRLIEVYLGRLPKSLADRQRLKLENASLDSTTFAWAGGVNRGQRHYYRLHGPDFLAEYDCTQNQANHIHAVWRDLANDFAHDLLKRHYRSSHR